MLAPLSYAVGAERARLPATEPERAGASRAAPTTDTMGMAGGQVVDVGGRPLPILGLQRAAGNRATTIALGRHSAASVQRRPVGPETTYREEPEDRQSMSGEADTGGDGPAAKTPPKKMTGYFGMNPEATRELSTLKKTAGEDAVLATTGNAELEKILAEEPAIADFVFDDLGISPGKYARWSKAIDALVVAHPKVRDALGELMRWMNQAEDGQIVLDRLVLSGHSNGIELWGTPTSPNAAQKPGVLIVEQDLGNVAAAFPTAAAQVRSIMFSACETVGAVEAVIRVFPNVDSVWAYAGFSPSVAQGSGKHIETWQAATAGGGTPNKKDAKGATAIWTRQDKWIVHDPGKGNFVTMYTQAMSLFEGPVRGMLRGAREIDQSELRRIYGQIQEVGRHPAIDEDKKAGAKKAMQIILRLRHWEPIVKHFAESRAPDLIEPYKAFGAQTPNWATITRAQLYRHTQELKKLYLEYKGDKSVTNTIEKYVFNGLFALEDDKIIPVEWNE